MDTLDRLIWRMSRAGESVTKKAYAAYISMLHDDRATAVEYIRGLGYVEIDADESELIRADDATYHRDGRVVMRAQGKMWACDADVYRRRRDEFFAKLRGHSPVPETKSVVGTESLSQMVCPKCGDSLQHTAVCPKCDAGKLGYRHRYTCVCGGFDLVSREAL